MYFYEKCVVTRRTTV